jgi:hypothetical protein
VAYNDTKPNSGLVTNQEAAHTPFYFLPYLIIRPFSVCVDVDGRIILRWIFRKLEGFVGTGWSWFSIETGGGHL